MRCSSPHWRCDLMMKLPPQVNTAFEMLEAAGYEAYLVGGAVRDYVRDNSPAKDWDITTNALPEQVEEIFTGYHLIETGLKHRPRMRLTKEEVDALNSLAIARTDLIKISNVLSKKTAEEKARFFKNEKFMRWWIDAVAGLIQHWYSIEENIATNVQTKSKEDT